MIMKEYVNFASKFRIMIVFINLIFIFMVIIRLSTLHKGAAVDIVVMCSVLLAILALLDTYFIYMKDVFNITKYNDEKIVNRFILKRKELSYSEIKQVIYIGNYLVLLNEYKEVENITKKGNILFKNFRKEVIFYLGNDEILLSNISKKAKCTLYIIGHDTKKKTYFEKFFEVKEL